MDCVHTVVEMLLFMLTVFVDYGCSLNTVRSYTSSTNCPPDRHSAPPASAGVDLNKPRMRDALKALLALAPAPNGFTVAEFTAKVHAMTGTSNAAYSIRQAAYDLRKIRGKQLLDKPARSRRYHVEALAARTIAALLTLRNQVITPILAGVRSPRMGRKPAVWTSVDRDYEQLRTGMQTLYTDLGLDTTPPLAV